MWARPPLTLTLALTLTLTITLTLTSGVGQPALTFSLARTVSTAGRLRECGYLRCYIMRNVPEVRVRVKVRVGYRVRVRSRGSVRSRAYGQG